MLTKRITAEKGLWQIMCSQEMSEGVRLTPLIERTENGVAVIDAEIVWPGPIRSFTNFVNHCLAERTRQLYRPAGGPAL